jgi:hypothetical protein
LQSVLALPVFAIDAPALAVILGGCIALSLMLGVAASLWTALKFSLMDPYSAMRRGEL